MQIVMADILGAVFRRFASGASDFTFPSLVEGNTVVLGEVDISRCVLFLSAVTAATDLALKVLFFTHTPFQSLPVSLRASVPGLKLESLKNVRFVYVRTLQELLEDVASLHELSSPPSLIIVEALDQYLQGCGGVPLQDELSPVAHAAALLHDTAEFLTHVLQERGDAQGLCRILVSCQPERDGIRDGEAQTAELLLSVLDRFLQVRCTLEQEMGQDQWQVYLSFTCPSPALQVQQWHMGRQAGGALEFRPVIDGQQQWNERDGDGK